MAVLTLRPVHNAGNNLSTIFLTFIVCTQQLYGKLTKKHQPDYKHAMKSIAAEEMYNEFLDLLKSNYEREKIKDGVFGAMMDVALVNDGPVTIIIESSPAPPSEPTIRGAGVVDAELANVE